MFGITNKNQIPFPFRQREIRAVNIEVSLASIFSDAGRAVARRRRAIATSTLFLILLAPLLVSFLFVSSFPDHITSLKKVELTGDNPALGGLRLARPGDRDPLLPQLVTGTEPFQIFAQIWQYRLTGFIFGVHLFSSEADFTSVYHRRPSLHLCSATSLMLKICSDFCGFFYRISSLEFWVVLLSHPKWVFITLSPLLSDKHISAGSHRRRTVFTPADLGQFPKRCSQMHNWWWAWPNIDLMVVLFGPLFVLDAMIHWPSLKYFWRLLLSSTKQNPSPPPSRFSHGDQEKPITTSSSNLRERPCFNLPPFMGGNPSLILFSKKLLNVLTALISIVLVCTRSIETTKKEFVVKSRYKVTISLPVDDYELNANSYIGVLVFDSFDSSPGALSSFFKFVSLCLGYVCSRALIFKSVIRICLNMLNFYVSL